MYVCGGCGQSTCDPRICVQVTIIIANPEVHHHSWTVAVEVSNRHTLNSIFDHRVVASTCIIHILSILT